MYDNTEYVNTLDFGYVPIRKTHTEGKVMNDFYDLSGNNRYPDDSHIVSVIDIDLCKVTFKRFEIGGRWFDDIVDNNASREAE